MLLNTGTELVRSKSGLLTTVCYKFGDEDAGVRAGGLDRGHRLGRAVAARPARHHPRRRGERDAGPLRSRTTAGSTSCRRSPACSRRTGAPTPAARSSGCPGSTPARTSPGPPWRRSATRAGRRRRDGEGLRGAPGRAQGRRRRHRQRPVHADPGRRPRRAGQPAGGRRDHGARRGVRGRAGGRASGTNTDELRENWNEDKRWNPQWTDEQRADGYAGWKKAVERTLDWVEVD